MADDPLTQPADRAAIESLYAAGHLGAAARRAAIGWLRPPLAWWRWASRMLLFLGAALVLSGIVFFFAYNWARMGAFVKFGLIEGALVASLVAAWVVGIDRIAGKVLLLGAAVLVGVLLAVYGQVYQTGADAYELFVGWALLIVGWVAISRFGGLWLMWLVILNTAVILYWGQVAEPNDAMSVDAMFVLLAVINGLALMGREWGVRLGRTWLAGRWLRWVLLASALAYLTIPVLNLIVEPDEMGAMTCVAALLWMGAMAAAYGFYRLRAPDLFALTLALLSGCVVVLTGIGKVLFELWDEAPMYLFFGLVILAVMTAAALWLHRVGKALDAPPSIDDGTGEP